MEVIVASIIGAALFSFFNLPTLYQLQIKEYFIPRIWSGLKEKDGFWIPYRKPALSIRNILILGIATILTSAYFYILAARYDQVTFGFVALWTLGSIIAKASVFMGMQITEPLAQARREALILRARDKARKSDAKFVGITGSYGKTSVKEFLITVLRKKYSVEGTKENYNSEVGVAISVNERLNENTEIFVAEMAAYRIGTIKRSASIIEPTIGFITGLGNQHISLFGGQQQIYDAKGELVEVIPKEGVVYMNMDTEGCDYVRKKAKGRIVTYSITSKAADIYAEVINSSSFKLHYNGYEEVFRIQLLGEHNVLNLLGVIACALDMGVPIEDVKEAVENIPPLKQRLTVFSSEEGGVLIDDSYNINREGFMSGLKYLSSHKNRKRFVVTRGMLELGNQIKDEYEKIGKFCKDNNIQIVTTDKRFLGYSDVVTVIDERKIADYILENLSEDVILLE